MTPENVMMLIITIGFTMCLLTLVASLLPAVITGWRELFKEIRKDKKGGNDS